jgi:hypothetical protein
MTSLIIIDRPSRRIRTAVETHCGEPAMTLASALSSSALLRQLDVDASRGRRNPCHRREHPLARGLRPMFDGLIRERLHRGASLSSASRVEITAAHLRAIVPERVDGKLMAMNAQSLCGIATRLGGERAERRASELTGVR